MQMLRGGGCYRLNAPLENETGRNVHQNWRRLGSASAKIYCRHFLMPIDPDECRQHALECVPHGTDHERPRRQENMV